MMQSGLQNMKSEMKLGQEHPENQVVYWATIGSIGVSLALFAMKRVSLANFIGLWVPSILGLGIFMKENKILDMEKRNHPSRMGTTAGV